MNELPPPLWLYPTAQYDYLISESSQWLSTTEIDHSKKILNQDSANNYILQRIILRKKIQELTGLNMSGNEFHYTHKGRPYLANSDWDFNISHTQNYFAVALVKEGCVGIDIEEKNRTINVKTIAKKVLHPLEIEIMHDLREDQEKIFFQEIWTKKEAYSKMLGLGLSLGFNKLLAQNLPADFQKIDQTNITGYLCYSKKSGPNVDS